MAFEVPISISKDKRALYLAILQNDLTTLESFDNPRLLNQLLGINQRNPAPTDALSLNPKTERLTPLTLAVLRGKADTVKLLLSLGADPNAFRGQAIFYTAHPEVQEKAEKILLLLRAGGSLESLQSLDVFGMNFAFHTSNDAEGIELWNSLVFFVKEGGKEVPRDFIRGVLWGATYEGRLSLLKHVAQEEGNLLKARFGSRRDTLFHAVARSPRLLRDTKLLEDFLSYLVNNGLHIDAQNEEGLAPLHVLVAYAGEEQVKLFLKFGASPNVRDKRGRTPIFFTLFESDIWRQYRGAPRETAEALGALKALLEGGADPNLPIAGEASILYRYLSEARPPLLEVVELLLKAGVDPNFMPERGYRERPLGRLISSWFATRNQTGEGTEVEEDLYFRLARTLLEHGADPLNADGYGLTLLSLLAQRYPLQKPISPELELLVRTAHKLGSEVGGKEPDGYTPLHRAAGKEQLFELYASLAKASDFDIKSPWGRTVLHHLAMEANVPGFIEALKRGATFHLEDGEGNPPIIYLLSKIFYPKRGVSLLQRLDETSKLLDFLKDQGVDLARLRGQKGQTVLHALTRGMNEVPNEKLTMTKEEEKKVVEIISKLVKEHGVPLNAKNALGNTPLHFLASFGAPFLLKKAIDLGAQTWLLNEEGSTPGDVIVNITQKKRLPKWMVSLGLFPLKRIDVTLNTLEEGDEEVADQFERFLVELLKDEPFLGMRLFTEWGTKSETFIRIFQKAVANSPSLEI